MIEYLFNLSLEENFPFQTIWLVGKSQTNQQQTISGKQIIMHYNSVIESWHFDFSHKTSYIQYITDNRNCEIPMKWKTNEIPLF